MADLELDTVNELADFLGAARNQVSNWLNGYNFPPVHYMDVLCQKRPGLTLDWIYRGQAGAVPRDLAIKLEALTLDFAIPLGLEPEQPANGHVSAPSERGRKKAT